MACRGSRKVVFPAIRHPSCAMGAVAGAHGFLTAVCILDYRGYGRVVPAGGAGAAMSLLRAVVSQLTSKRGVRMDITRSGAVVLGCLTVFAAAQALAADQLIPGKIGII